MNGHQQHAINSIIDRLIEGDASNEKEKEQLKKLKTEVVPWNTANEVLERIIEIHKEWELIQ